VLLYANFIPTGRHFFYLVKNNSHAFLSPKYEIVPYKDTNIYLN
jgi:hypothetical protein